MGLSERNPAQWSNRWAPVLVPGDIVFVPNDRYHDPSLLDIRIHGVRVGWLKGRPDWCDRGRFEFGCELPDIDEGDSFPRYFMDEVRAKLEIIAWFNWRLWGRRVV
jgi:hypothetical protein